MSRAASGFWSRTPFSNRTCSATAFENFQAKTGRTPHLKPLLNSSSVSFVKRSLPPARLLALDDPEVRYGSGADCRLRLGSGHCGCRRQIAAMCHERPRHSRLKRDAQDLAGRFGGRDPLYTAGIRGELSLSRLGIQTDQTKIESSTEFNPSTARLWPIAYSAGALDRRRLTRLTNWSGRKGLAMKSAAPFNTARRTSRSHRDAVNIRTGVSR